MKTKRQYFNPLEKNYHPGEQQQDDYYNENGSSKRIKINQDDYLKQIESLADRAVELRQFLKAHQYFIELENLYNGFPNGHVSYLLAGFYSTGGIVKSVEIKKNKEKADGYFKRAYEKLKEEVSKGNDVARYDLAMMYCNGIAVEKDRNLSLQYIQLLCDKGCTKAQTTIGFWYRHGFIVDRDFIKSLEYYKMAADKGHPGAQNDIANMFEEGYGVEPNIDLAVYYYKLASDQGHTAAMYNLGTMYESGVGVKMDKTMALKFYQSSADEGDPDASWAAGTFYETGHSRVISRNYKFATKYFYMATRTPDVQASKNAAQRLKQVLSGHKTEEYKLDAIEVLYVDSWPISFKVLNPLCKEAILVIWSLFSKSLLRDLLVLWTKKLILLWPGDHAQEFISEPF